MHGTLDIRRSSNPGTTLDLYQVRYEDLAGNSFSASMNQKELRELLYHKVAVDLSDDQLDHEYDRLVRDGHIKFPEIEMREEELAGSGLRYLPPEG
jgi:hypothetical protein